MESAYGQTDMRTSDRDQEDVYFIVIYFSTRIPFTIQGCAGGSSHDILCNPAHLIPSEVSRKCSYRLSHGHPHAMSSEWIYAAPFGPNTEYPILHTPYPGH